MTSKFFHRITTRVRQEAVLSSIIAFFGVIAKFSYIIVRKDAGEYAITKMFGYRYLSQFLWVLGNEVFAFTIGAFIFIIANMIPDRSMKRNVKAIAIFTIATSLYFIGWIFFGEFYEEPTEIVMSIIFSLVFTALSIWFLANLTRIINSISELTEYFTSKIRLLTDCLILKTPYYVRNQDVYFEEVVEPTLEKLNE